MPRYDFESSFEIDEHGVQYISQWSDSYHVDICKSCAGDGDDEVLLEISETVFTNEKTGYRYRDGKTFSCLKEATNKFESPEEMAESINGTENAHPCYSEESASGNPVFCIVCEDELGKSDN